MNVKEFERLIGRAEKLNNRFIGIIKDLMKENNELRARIRKNQQLNPFLEMIDKIKGA